MPGPWEIAGLLLIVAIILGVGRLSQIGGSVGKSVRSRGAVRGEPAAATPTPVSPPPVYCPECGASNTGTNRFCSACGATFRSAAPVAPGVEAAPPSTSGIAPSAAAPYVVDHSTAASAGGEESSETAAETAPIDAGRTANPPTSMGQNTCPSCATVNPPGQPFCGQCGTRLKPQAA